jgi:uncharacterized cupredoxin-like copper-binding protein
MAGGPGRPAVPGRSGGRRRTRLVVVLVTAVVLLVGSVTAAIAWGGPSRPSAAVVGGGWGGMMGGWVVASVPQLAGTTVRVTAADMGAMMGGGRAGLVLDRGSAPAGTVSLVLTNAGRRTHELVVLPLAAGQQVGTRAVGADGTVNESGSLGEASRSGGADAGDGIAPGTAGWTTLDLPAGRYELICNIAGHYAAGMYAELTVS